MGSRFLRRDDDQRVCICHPDRGIASDHPGGPSRLASVATFIVRTFEEGSSSAEGLRGTVARPGGDELPFRSLIQLGELLLGDAGEPAMGNDAGSTSSSAIRDA